MYLQLPLKGQQSQHITENYSKEYGTPCLLYLENGSVPMELCSGII